MRIYLSHLHQNLLSHSFCRTVCKPIPSPEMFTQYFAGRERYCEQTARPLPFTTSHGCPFATTAPTTIEKTTTIQHSKDTKANSGTKTLQRTECCEGTTRGLQWRNVIGQIGNVMRPFGRWTKRPRKWDECRARCHLQLALCCSNISIQVPTQTPCKSRQLQRTAVCVSEQVFGRFVRNSKCFCVLARMDAEGYSSNHANTYKETDRQITARDKNEIVERWMEKECERSRTRNT